VAKGDAQNLAVILTNSVATVDLAGDRRLGPVFEETFEIGRFPTLYNSSNTGTCWQILLLDKALGGKEVHCLHIIMIILPHQDQNFKELLHWLNKTNCPHTLKK
jgi:hypothetical protein